MRYVFVSTILSLFACTSSTPLPDAAVDSGFVDAVADAPPMTPEQCVEVSAGMETEAAVALGPAAIETVDVYFLMDVTASMVDEIDVLRAALITTVIPGARSAAPDAWFAVGSFGDFPVSPFGDLTDSVLEVHQPSTADDAAVERAVAAYALGNGRDQPESLVEALYLSVTGEGLGAFVAPAACPEGRTGHPCFRPQSVPVFVVFTDAPSHEGLDGSHPYTGVTPTPHVFSDAAGALVAAGARLVGMDSGFGNARVDLEPLATATGTTRPDGTPLVFDVGGRGEGLDASVVQGITDLIRDVPMRVTLSLENVDGDAEDAASWFGAPRLEGVDPPAARIADVGETVEIAPGATLRYALPLAAPSAMPSDAQRVRLSLREQAGSEVGALELTLVAAPIGCP